VTRLVGVGAGLAAERTYTRVTLPAGVFRGIADAFRGEPVGLLRAAAIVIGLGYTTAGYIIGSAAGRWRELRNRT
jgi:phage shock protein PspC (stress-responsive transcriptional regulator)